MLFAPVNSMNDLVAPCARSLPGGGAQSGSFGGPFAVASAPAGAPLASLAGGALARKFYRWRGSSGALYVFTVHPLGAPDWLEIDGAVVLIVAVDLDGRRRVVAVEADPAPARRRQLRHAASRRGGVAFEAHLHMLAETSGARARAAADLGAMATPPTPALQPGASSAAQSQLISSSSTPSSRICSTVARR